MPVGRFRNDPRELDEVEREVSAAQYPELALNLGMGLGILVPYLARMAAERGIDLVVTGPLAPLTVPGLPVAGPIVCGIVGYLLGHRYRVYRAARLREEG